MDIKEEFILMKKNKNMISAISNKRLMEFNDSVIYNMNNIINLSNIILEDYGICMSYDYFSPELYCPTIRQYYKDFNSKVLNNKLMLIIKFHIDLKKSKNNPITINKIFDDFIRIARNYLYSDKNDDELSERNIDAIRDKDDPTILNSFYDVVYGNEEYNDFIFYFTNMLRKYFL